MIYLTETDFQNHLGVNILSQIKGTSATLVPNAELQAIGIVKDMLSGMYDIEAELMLTGADRHAPLVLWLLTIASYQLYRQIPDDEVPPRIIKDYDDTMETLRQIGKGKHPTSITPIETEDGTSKRVFRMKSNTPRTHDML